MAENKNFKLNEAKTSFVNGGSFLPQNRGMMKVTEAKEKDGSESGVFRCVRKEGCFGTSSVMDERTIVVKSSGVNTSSSSPRNGGTLLPPKRGMIKAKIIKGLVKSIANKLAPKTEDGKPRSIEYSEMDKNTATKLNGTETTSLDNGGISLPLERATIKAKVMDKMVNSDIKLAP